MAARVFLVTGASSGIGEATARRLASEPGTALVLVARREDRLRELAAALPVETTFVAVDLTEPDAPERVAAHVEETHGQLHLLVNNAGASWRGTFGDEGWENVSRTMGAQLQCRRPLTEALLPTSGVRPPVRSSTSPAPRAESPGPAPAPTPASKFALAGWTDALHAEEIANRVHVGMVLPGFIATEGFPAAELREKAATRWLVSSPEKAAEAIVDVGLRGKAERYVPRPAVRYSPSCGSSPRAWSAGSSPAARRRR